MNHKPPRDSMLYLMDDTWLHPEGSSGSWEMAETNGRVTILLLPVADPGFP